MAKGNREYEQIKTKERENNKLNKEEMDEVHNKTRVIGVKGKKRR